MLDTIVQEQKQMLTRQERLKLLELRQLLDQDWRKMDTQDTQVYILDWESYRQLTQQLEKGCKQTLITINHPIICKNDSDDNDVYSQKELIQGLSLDPPVAKHTVKVIDCEMNYFIFNKLGCKGHQIKRRVTNIDFKKDIELYPKFIEFQVLSLGKLQQMQSKQNDSKCLLFQPSKKYKIRYVQNQLGSELYESIKSLLSCKNVYKRRDFRIYLFNSHLFRRVKFQRMLAYYFNREDLRNIASASHTHFYTIIDNKKYDQFAVEFFPGKLVSQYEHIALKESDRLVVQIFQAGKWVFPQQPPFSVAKKCCYCSILSQLYLKFDCYTCNKQLLFCSRVCQYASLLAHVCQYAKATLSMLYGADIISDENNTQKQRKTVDTSNEQKSQNEELNSSLQQPEVNTKIIDLQLASKQIPLNKVNSNGSSHNQSISKIGPPLNRYSSPQSISSNALPPNPSKKWRGGIQNLGNTCYMNASLQVVARTSLAQILLSLKTNRNTLSSAFADLLKQLQNSTERNPVKQNKILLFKTFIDDKIEQFRGNQQQDAHQFLMTFLDKMHDELNKNSKPVSFSHRYNHSNHSYVYDISHQMQARNQWFEYIAKHNSPITDLFYGQHMQSTECPYCHHKSVKFTPFSSISCPILSGQVNMLALYFQSHNFAQRLQKLQAAAKGTVENMFSLLKKSKIPTKKERYFKLFKTSFETHCCQIAVTTPLEKLYVQMRRTDIQKQLTIFESQYAAPSVYIFKLTLNQKDSFTYKRPIFLKAHYSQVTSKMLYKVTQNYFKNILKFYLKKEEYVLRKIQEKMNEDIELFFTLTYYTKGKVKQGKVQFPSNSCFRLSEADEKTKLYGYDPQSVSQIWVWLRPPPAKTYKDQEYYQKFYDIITNKIIKYVDTNHILGNIIQPVIQLEDCLKEEYNKKSVLDQKNQWHCPSCQEKRRAHLSTSLYKVPKYLLINIKRFHKNQYGSIYQKNRTRIKIPQQLNLKDLLKDPKLPQVYYLQLSIQEKKKLRIEIETRDIDDSESYCYNLKGFILHEGEIQRGHYKAIVMQAGQWILFNDESSSVVEIKKQLGEQNQRKFYVLLYQRKTH